MLTEADALRIDLQEAQSLAAEYQRSLAGKSNDLAMLKQTLEKAAGDLDQLQITIDELRAERHRLANALMLKEGIEDQVRALTERVKEVTHERDLFHARTNELQEELDRERAKRAPAKKDKKKEPQLTIDIEFDE